MPVLVTHDASAQGVRFRRVQSLCTRYLRALGMAECELSVLLCGDARIQALNRAHRNLDKPTDVLAFPQHEGLSEGLAPEDGLLGDIVVSLETAQAQANTQGHSLLVELRHLLAHGLLHLVGYDHQDDAQELRMNEEATRLVAESLRGSSCSAPAAAAAPDGAPG